ncbi:Scytalone dehydratase [Asimina triloba]
MARIFEYFVACGLGPEIRSLDGSKGFQGTGVMYMPSFLDQFPPTNKALYPPPPPQLPTCRECGILILDDNGLMTVNTVVVEFALLWCVLPAGVEFYSSGFDLNDVTTYPRSYPIVLTEGDGSKIYVSCVSFRDPVSEDIADAYHIPPNSFADKCICLVSRSPSFHVLRDALEELFTLCFSPSGSSKPLWDIIAHMVMNVPLPTPGKDRVLFAVENCLLSVTAPPKDGLPHADIPFQPLFQCLDVDNVIKLFTAVLLERRILLRSNKYSLLTIVSETICHLIYPFKWQHVYIPLLFFSGVDYIDAPTPYMMGLHSGVDTSGLAMDGVVVVDLEHNHITTSEEIPPIPEPEYSFLRDELMKLLYPKVVDIDRLKITQFLDSQGFMDYLERCIHSDDNSNNLLDKLQDAIGRGQNPTAILPSSLAEPEFITISDPSVGIAGTGAKYCYDRFPSNIRTEEQEEKRKAILAAGSGALEHSGKHTPSFLCIACLHVCDIVIGFGNCKDTTSQFSAPIHAKAYMYILKSVDKHKGKEFSFGEIIELGWKSDHLIVKGGMLCWLECGQKEELIIFFVKDVTRMELSGLLEAPLFLFVMNAVCIEKG